MASEPISPTQSQRVTRQEVRDALKVLNYATVSLCELLVEKCGTQRAAAKRLGISFVHFSRMSNGHAQASTGTLKAMCAVLRP